MMESVKEFIKDALICPEKMKLLLPAPRLWSIKTLTTVFEVSFSLGRKIHQCYHEIRSAFRYCRWFENFIDMMLSRVLQLEMKIMTNIFKNVTSMIHLPFLEKYSNLKIAYLHKIFSNQKNLFLLAYSISVNFAQ
jgi:hypothetical protein